MVALEFSSRNTWSGLAVRAFTWCWCSHVDLVLPDGRLLGALPGSGVQIRDWTPARRVERFHIDAPPALLQAVLERALSQIGRPYDWAGVLGMALRRKWAEQDSWFCSELVAWAFADAGHPLLRAQHLYRITPRDLLLSPRLAPVLPIGAAPMAAPVVLHA